MSLVQVNWYRGPDEPPDNAVLGLAHARKPAAEDACWRRPADQAFAALLDDLPTAACSTRRWWCAWRSSAARRRSTARGGRDHWGHVFSVALAGGGVKGGQVYGAIRQARRPARRTAACCRPTCTRRSITSSASRADTEIHDSLGRPMPVTRGEVVRAILGKALSEQTWLESEGVTRDG